MKKIKDILKAYKDKKADKIEQMTKYSSVYKDEQYYINKKSQSK